MNKIFTQIPLATALVAISLFLTACSSGDDSEGMNTRSGNGQNAGCVTDADCAENQKCDNGSCVASSETGNTGEDTGGNAGGTDAGGEGEGETDSGNTENPDSDTGTVNDSGETVDAGSGDTATGEDVNGLPFDIGGNEDSGTQPTDTGSSEDGGEMYCTTNADCTDRLKPYCNTATNTCELPPKECATDADCLDPMKPICNPTYASCVSDGTKCKDNSYCIDPVLKACNTKTGECVECNEHADCGTGYKCDTNNHTCFEDPNASGDCPSGTFCQYASGGATACLNNLGQTPSGTAQCDSSNKCSSGSTPVMQQDAFGNTKCYCAVSCQLK